MMKSSSLFSSISIYFFQLLLHATLSFAFLSTGTLPISARSQWQSSPSEFHTSISSFSKIAQIDANSSSFCLTDPDDFSAVHSFATNRGQLRKYNLASPREWLEYSEASQTHCCNQDDVPSSNLMDEYFGAYTVLRCDFSLEENSWRIWGKKFHLNRLRESYRSLLHKISFDSRSQEIDEAMPIGKYEEVALEASLDAMTLLLDEAKRTIERKIDASDIQCIGKAGKSIVTAMITLLWSLDDHDAETYEKKKSNIIVQGHAFSTLKVSQLPSDSDVVGSKVKILPVVQNPNAPIQAAIGHLPFATLERILKENDLTRSTSGNLPNRYQNYPEAKLSSWCRRRRLLEDIFKTQDIGDVILTKNHHDDGDDNGHEISPSSASPGSEKLSIELLEGLTSNLFFEYPGKVLRTAPSTHVLGGYVRQLIIDCAGNCGYRVEFSPIPLSDSSIWKEIFLTSSIRLIVPVKRILLPKTNCRDIPDELFQLTTLWELPGYAGKKNDASSLLGASNSLYMELLKHATMYGRES